VVEIDRSGWSGDGDFTERLIAVIAALPDVAFLKVDDAPASRADAAFSFVSNELFVRFASEPRRERTWRLGCIPAWRAWHEPRMSLEGLEAALAGVEDVGPPDYSDAGMLQYLRTTRIVPPYQTRGYKLVEMVRIYGCGQPDL
jgi:hypothetical protein